MYLKEGTRSVLEAEVADTIASIIEEESTKGNVIFAIPGGRSVSGIFTLLSTKKLPWNKVHFFMVDERFVPLSHELSNYRLAHEVFLSKLLHERAIPKENIHPFTFNQNEQLKALEQYEKLLKRIGGRFSIVLLSSGEDGHVAALYPEHASVRNRHSGFIRVVDSPKPPAERMTASASLIQSSSHAFLLFFGEEKDEAFQLFLDESTKPGDCPAKLITSCPNSYVFHTKER